MLNQTINQDVDIILNECASDLAKLSGQNILITGAAGMLARYLVYTFIEANRKLPKLLKHPINLYLIIRSKQQPFGQANPHLHYLHLDIAKTKPAVKKIDYIIHAASKSSSESFMKNLTDTLATNIRGTYNLLDTTDHHLKSFLYLSSGAVYGANTPNRTLDETFVGAVDHLSPKSAYTIGKLAVETILMNYFRERKLPIKIARIFHTFGPGLNLDDGRVFSDFIKAGWRGKNIEIKGDASVTRPYLYISDATIMFLKLLTSTKNGQVYNIANDQQIYSVGEFAGIVTKVVNQKFGKKITVVKKPAKTKTYYEHVSRTYRPTIDKFRRDFNWEPKVNIDKAVERTVGSLIDVSH